MACVSRRTAGLVYDGAAHHSLATLPGMAERTLTVNSGAKTFGFTGWKVGWVTGPRELLSVVTKAHQFLTFTTSPALQAGVAHGLTHEMDFPIALTKRLQKNRDVLAAGHEVLPSHRPAVRDRRTYRGAGRPADRDH